jgi:hypothetical protein
MLLVHYKVKSNMLAKAVAMYKKVAKQEYIILKTAFDESRTKFNAALKRSDNNTQAIVMVKDSVKQQHDSVSCMIMSMPTYYQSSNYFQSNS